MASSSSDDSKVYHSDSDTFACCALQAVALTQLFGDESHRQYCKEYMECILDYFQQPEQVKRTCLSIIADDNSHEMGPYAESLRSASKDPWMTVTDLIRNCLLALTRRGQYDARSRVVLKHVCVPLRINWDLFEEMEEGVVGLLEMKVNSDAETEGTDRAKSRRKKRYALIGLAAVGGGALIGLTGGLAAPLIAAGAGVLVGGGATAVIGTTAGAAVLGSFFGIAGAGLTGYKMKKRIGALSEFEFVPMSTTKHLSVAIAISGWIKSDVNDFYLPWKTLDISKEQYYLRWESQYLKEMGQAMDYILGCVKTMAIQETLKLTVLSGLLTAIAWPAALISAASVIDNPWSVCLNRADEAGRVLANLLVCREHGSRPVTLIGFSVGAKVIFSCLQELAKRRNNTEGIIENVYLLGAPVTSSVKSWEPFTKIVAGKIVNCYSRSDWLLKFLFRTATVSVKIAGLEPIQVSDRRMCNVDLTSFVNGHKEYFRQMDEILRLIGVRTRQPITRSVSGVNNTLKADTEASPSLFTRGKVRSQTFTSIPQPTGQEEQQKVETEVAREAYEEVEGEEPEIREKGSSGSTAEVKGSQAVTVLTEGETLKRCTEIPSETEVEEMTIEGVPSLLYLPPSTGTKRKQSNVPPFGNINDVVMRSDESRQEEMSNEDDVARMSQSMFVFSTKYNTSSESDTTRPHFLPLSNDDAPTSIAFLTSTGGNLRKLEALEKDRTTEMSKCRGQSEATSFQVQSSILVAEETETTPTWTDSDVLEMEEIPNSIATLPCPPETEEALEEWRASRRLSRPEYEPSRFPTRASRRRRRTR